MIAVLFEVEPVAGREDAYPDIAADLRPLLETIDGFVSVERFRSLARPDVLLSLSFVCTGLALLVYFRLLATLGPIGTASQSYLRAIVGVALGVILLGERPEATTATGLAFAVIGVLLINWPIPLGKRAK